MSAKRTAPLARSAAQSQIAAKVTDDPIVQQPVCDSERPSAAVVARFRDAYAVVVIGKAARRHVFFGLPAAQKAVDRARARGDFAELVLVKLQPVGGAR